MVCCVCGRSAAEYDPRTDALYCADCADDLADARWQAMSRGERAEAVGMEEIKS